MGQAAPWTTVFPTIHLEFGNEVWNSGFSGANFTNAAAYGKRTAAIFGAARANPSFVASSFDLVMDGWVVNPWWNQTALAAAANYDSISVAPYLFDTLNDLPPSKTSLAPCSPNPSPSTASPAA